MVCAGENGPVHKSCSPNEKHGMVSVLRCRVRAVLPAAHAHLFVRVFQLWKGTVVAQGVGTFVVTATAANTRTGNLLKKIKQIRVRGSCCSAKLCSSVQLAQVPRSPLQVLLKSLALKLSTLLCVSPRATLTLTAASFLQRCWRLRSCAW